MRPAGNPLSTLFVAILVDQFSETKAVNRLHNLANNVTFFIASDVLGWVGPPKITKLWIRGFDWLLFLALWIDVIQDVRDRANMPDREQEFAGLTQEAMRDRIAHERLVELAGEGKRFDDIRRWGWLQDPDKLQMLRDRDSEFDGFSQGREWLPIPQGELDSNPNIQQNPGYSGG